MCTSCGFFAGGKHCYGDTRQLKSGESKEEWGEFDVPTILVVHAKVMLTIFIIGFNHS